MTRRTWLAVAAAAGLTVAAATAEATPGKPPLRTASPGRTCATYFVASVHHGPHSGLDRRGVLRLRLDAGGRLRGGTFASFAGRRVAVAGAVHGHAIGLAIASPGGTLRGTGRVEGSLAHCVGRMRGELRGPGRHDRGSWLATSGQSLQLPNGAVLVTSAETANHPNPQVIYRVPDISAPVTVFAGALNTPGNVDGQRLAARMNRPAGLAYDAARSIVYLADAGNGAIRSLNMNTNQVTTSLRSSDFVAAAHALGYSNVGGWEPQGVVLSPGGGAILVTDARNFVVWKYNPATAQLRLFAGIPGASGHADGSDSAVRFSAPQQITTSSDGIVAVAEPTANRVRLRDPSGNGSWSSLVVCC